MEKRSVSPRLRGRKTADVVIVGGGFTGLTAAVMLSRCGLRTIVLEARTLGCGATSRCAGVVSMGCRVQYAQLKKERGFAAAQACLSTRQSAWRKIREWGGEADFGWRSVRLQLCAADSRAAGMLAQEEACLRRAGIQTVLKAGGEGPFPAAAALEWNGQAVVEPEKYLQFLIGRALRQNVRIFEDSRVCSMDAETVYSQEGSVRAPFILIATGYPVLHTPSSLFPRLEQRERWRILVRAKTPFEGLFADAQGAYVFSSGSNGMLLQLGGAHAGARQEGQISRSFRERYAPFLPAGETERRRGLEVFSADGLPFIGLCSPRSPNVYMAAGYGGEGILGSMTAAQALTALILGLPSDGYGVYAPRRPWGWRMPLKLAGRWLGGTLLHSAQPRCPHMGCRLVYRHREKIWECPCHGAQFDSLGRVLSAPALFDAEVNRE